MEPVIRTREASRTAVRDVTPDELRDAIYDLLADGSAIPGVLTELSARSTRNSVDEGDLATRTAGVQLIYQGLALTRSLAREEPWRAADDPPTAANVGILAADVMVSRGFSLLARTEVAETAVETVRTFGRTETEWCEGRPPKTTLEAEVFELAIVAGTTAADVSPPHILRQYAASLADSFETPLPGAETAALSTIAEEFRQRLSHRRAPSIAEEPAPHSSATDP